MPAAVERKPRTKELTPPKFGLVHSISLREPGKYHFTPIPLERAFEGETIAYGEESDKALLEKFPNLFRLGFNEAYLRDDEYFPAALTMTHGLEPIYAGRRFIVGADNVTETVFERNHVSNGEGHTITYIDRGIPYIKKNKLLFAPTEREGELELTFAGWRDRINYKRGPYKWDLEVEFSGEKPGAVIEVIVETLNKIKEEKDLPLWRDYQPDSRF